MAAKKNRAVVVTDTHRGIYFGYLAGTLEGGAAVRLEGARHCFRYTKRPGHEGTYGLATGGPGDGSHIGPRVTMTIRDVSKVIDCTDDAAKKWEAAKWGG